MGHIADAKGNSVGIEMPVREGQRFGIAAHPLSIIEYIAVDGAVAPFIQHGLVDVTHGDVARGTLQHPKGDIARSTRHIQNLHAGTRAQPTDHVVLPQTVQATAHKIVHQVIARGDGIEHATNQRFLFLFGDGLKTKMGSA